MNKALILFLVLAGLAALINAADVKVNVGNAKGENVFEPAMIVAAPNDNIIFTWVGTGKHSIVQSDEAKTCAKSATLTTFNSGEAFTAPKVWEVKAPAEVGKWWFYCGVPGHCKVGGGGMEATLVVTADGKAPADAGGDAPKDGKTPAEAPKDGAPKDGAPAASPSPAAGAASRNSAFAAGALLSGVMAAAALL